MHFGKGEEFTKLLERARPAWLVVALLLQAGTYVCAGGVWQRALARQGRGAPLPEMVRLGVIKVFMDQAVPSAGISGNVLVARALGRRGMSHESAVATVLAGLISFYIATGLAVGASLLILWLIGRVSRAVTVAATAFAVVLAIILSAILWVTRSRRRVPAWTRKIKPLHTFLQDLGAHPPHVVRDFRFLAEATALQLGLIALDAATLWVVLRSLGVTMPAAGAFAAYTMASIVALLSLLPAGLGSFDGTSIAMLHAFHVPIGAAVAGTVLLRGFTFVLPLMPGFWLARREAIG